MVNTNQIKRILRKVAKFIIAATLGAGVALILLCLAAIAILKSKQLPPWIDYSSYAYCGLAALAILAACYLKFKDIRDLIINYDDAQNEI
jgi:uncharacterized protein involved in cysteine biosynthesis